MNPIRKFPGHFAGAFIPRVGVDGMVEVLVIGVLPIQYREANNKLRLQRLQVKMPGGCAQNHEENANLSLALVRELHGEIAKDDDFQVSLGKQVFQRVKPGRSPSEPKHRQSFYYTQFQGELRNEDVVEDEGDEILAPPCWVEARQLWSTIFPSHREPLVAGLEHLALASPEVAYQYSDILATRRSGQS